MHKLQQNLGYYFDNPSLLRLALTHKSYAHSNRLGQSHNERLEFLGDSILGLVITDIIFNKYPDEAEGVLTNMRAALVKESTLAEMARKLEISKFILLDSNEHFQNGRDKDSILSSTYEAIVAAIYRDGGLRAVTTVIQRHFVSLVEDGMNLCNLEDPKGKVANLCLKKFGETPVYAIIAKEGLDHAPVFKISASINGLEVYGQGTTRKKAEKEAAMLLLKEIRP